MQVLGSSSILEQIEYNHHKILVVKRQMPMENSEIRTWYCGYVSRNRIDEKVKLNVSPKEVYDFLDENAICIGGITYHGQLTDPVNFMGDVIGFDTCIPALDNIDPEIVIESTKKLCDQLVEFENKHILTYR